MYHGHLGYMPLKANPERAEAFARQLLKYCRRLRLKRQLDRLYPLLVLLLTVAVFGSLLAFSAL